MQIIVFRSLKCKPILSPTDLRVQDRDRNAGEPRGQTGLCRAGRQPADSWPKGRGPAKDTAVIARKSVFVVEFLYVIIVVDVLDVAVGVDVFDVVVSVVKIFVIIVDIFDVFIVDILDVIIVVDVLDVVVIIIDNFFDGFSKGDSGRKLASPVLDRVKN